MVKKGILNMILIRFLLIFMTIFTVVEAKKSDSVQLNISDMEIEQFIKMVAKIDDKNILIPLNVRGKINYVSKKPILKKNIFTLLQTILKEKGFTIVDSTKGYYIVSRISDANKNSPRISNYTNEYLVHTAIIKIKNMNASKISGNLKSFLSRSGRILISQETNSLVITDLPTNIKTVKTLIAKLDKRSDVKLEFIELKHIKASDAYSQLKSISATMFNQKIISEKISIFKNDTTNSIILIATQKQINFLKRSLKKLDKPDKATKQNIYFVKLNNSNAEDVVKVMNQVISKKIYKKGSPKASVTFDKELNSLILIASEIEYSEFLELISKLDIERKQVYVKARIVEISEKKAQKLGIKYGIMGFDVTESGLYSLSSSLNGGSALPPSGLGVSIPKNLSYGFGLGVGLSFLNSNGVSNTLSEPSILCINNQESSIYVGQTESILSSSTQGSTTTSLAQNSYTREDIGLTLKIKPRISNDNKVILNIDATLEDVVAGSGGGLPTTTKRTVKTVAVVRDGEAVIVGGLIKDKITVSHNKIPLLGDIPLLGALFRDTIKGVDKVNLVIILTPYVIEKASDLETLRKNLQELSKIEKDVVRKLIEKGLETNKTMKPVLNGGRAVTETTEDIDFDD